MDAVKLLAQIIYKILKRILQFAFVTMQCYVYEEAEVPETLSDCLASLGNSKSLN